MVDIEKLTELVEKADTHEGLVVLGKVVMKEYLQLIKDQNGAKLDGQTRLQLTYLKAFERWLKLVKDSATLREVEQMNERLKKLELARKEIEKDFKK